MSAGIGEQLLGGGLLLGVQPGNGGLFLDPGSITIHKGHKCPANGLESLAGQAIKLLHRQLTAHIGAGHHLLNRGLGDPGGAQARAAARSIKIQINTYVVAHAVFTGVTELEGIDGFIPVAACAAGVGVEPRHETLGTAQLQLGLEGRALVAFNQGDGLLALVGEEEGDCHGAGGIALAGRCRAAMPTQIQAVAVRPEPAGEALGGGDLAMAEGQRLLAWSALPALLLTGSALFSGDACRSVGVGALGKSDVVAPGGDQMQIATWRQQHAHADGRGEQLRLGRTRFAAAAVITGSWFVLAVGLFGFA